MVMEVDDDHHDDVNYHHSTLCVTTRVVLTISGKIDDEVSSSRVQEYNTFKKESFL